MGSTTLEAILYLQPLSSTETRTLASAWTPLATGSSLPHKVAKHN